MTIPTDYIVTGAAAYSLSPDESELWYAPVNADGTIDWDNLGDIFDADGSAPHIATLTALLKAARDADARLGECF